MIIQHNLSAMNANRQLNVNVGNKQKAMEKLSSGYRINRAADDAAGLGISEKMRSQIRGLNRGTTNIQEGRDMCNVADGALNEVNNILLRINVRKSLSYETLYFPHETVILLVLI